MPGKVSPYLLGLSSQLDTPPAHPRWFLEFYNVLCGDFSMYSMQTLECIMCRFNMFYGKILACIMCSFLHVVDTDFSMYYVDLVCITYNMYYVQI